jgi:DNA-binding beta-propeller fold protein YncE
MSARARYVAALITTIALGAALSSSCNLENPGDEAPAGALYFPNALAISNETGTAPRFLFVASTNFDLRYRSGALHALSLDEIDDAIAACPKLGAEDCVIEVDKVLADEVLIPTYATALALDPDGKRLVLASRTEDRLMTINVNLDADDAAGNISNAIASDLLGCESPASRSCGTGTQNGTDVVSAEALGQPEAPSDLVIGRLSDLTGDPEDDQLDYVALAHQRGAVSLYIDEDDSGDSLTLTSVAEDLGRTPTGIARDPVSGLFHVSLLGNQLLRLGVTFDSDGEFANTASLFNAAPLGIAGASLGQLRSIAFLDQPVGLGVGEGESQALIVANVPSALVLANVTPGASSTTTGRVQRVAEIGAGGTKLALGSVGGRPVAAVSCLEGRSIYIVDLTSMETRAVVPNLSGPFGVAFDEARERLYVTDFRSSVLRVVDLSLLASSEDAPESVRVVATVGRPRVVQELK